ncbi:MAG: phospho-N-acetylmuramoyl-pentapeptide-transferase [Firmicutes bacterium]|nr:phospho-N-acetylmuramoyl-pentapeptide-transferase [Bacillota bacterium]
MGQALLAFLAVFAASFLFIPLVIRLAKRLKLRQTVLHYVEEHKIKSGTPTMGGIGFILPLILVVFFSRGNRSLLWVTIAVTFAYMIVGFLDDFLKVYFKKNDGLKAWQKLVFQAAIAIIVSVFAFLNPSVGGNIYVFFGFRRIDLGWFAIPFYVLIFAAFTNSVNLTDGLDGLASSLSIVYTAFFAAILALSITIGSNLFLSGGQAIDANRADEIHNLIVFSLGLVGGLLAFMVYNGYPAKIFMGDTGSLGIGGALASLAIFSGRILIVPILGIMFIVSSVSVILQVLYFKKTKGKRIFLMAPYHHHLEKKGVHETKIGLYYCVITAIIGALCIVFILI